MAKLEFSGLSDYIASLERLEASVDGITKKALYQGAAVVADDIRASVESLPTDESYGTQKHPAKGIKKGQKEALAKGLGVAPFQEDEGMIHTLIGFSGYSNYPTKKYPKGQPLALIARVAESGTSFSRKTPFVRKAIRKEKPKAEQAMKEVFEKEIDKIMKE